ncbi:MAG TPA: hypothetical protein VIH90_05620 [Candidatus Saccharimonadales bacterium]
MEWTTLRPETNEGNKFIIAFQIFRRAEYVCLWRLRGETPITPPEVLDALKTCVLIDPLFIDEPVQTEWGELSPTMVDDIRQQCRALFDDEVDTTARFIGLSDTMLTVASNRLIDVGPLQTAVADFARMQQPMLRLHLA